MCGICGEWSAHGIDASRLARMQARLAHRGPDGSGQVVGEHERSRADHHARLWLILDLEAWFRFNRLGDDPTLAEDWLARPRAA